jgi:hypothetical protein
MKLQLCFSAKTKEQSDIVLGKLKSLKEKLDEQYGEYTVHSCHLTKKIVLEKGFDTTIVDGFAEIFGDKYHCEVTANNFEDAMKEMNSYRIATSKKVDRLVILSTEQVSNVALELQYFTDNKVICI